MEDQFQLLNNGQSVLKADFNTLGEVSGLADDRVLAELFRMRPYDGSTVRKGVLPYGHAASGAAGLVAPNGASGSILVNPFRAFVGSRTAVGTNAKKNWRDIRSAIAVGATTLAQTVALGANASGNPRWDLIYAAVAVDANSASVTRKVKNPTTKAIAGQSVVSTLVTTVTLGVQAGTAAASPVWPTAPADAGSTYYVPIAYVRVPNGFGAASTVLVTDFAVVAPCLALNPKTGAVSGSVANGQFNLTTAQQQAWGSSGTRPNRYMPSSMMGGETLWVYLDLFSATKSHAHGDVVDDRDWRGRLCVWTATITLSADPRWNGAAGTWPGETEFFEHSAAATKVLFGFGQSMQRPVGSDTVCLLDGAQMGTMADTDIVRLYVDGADGGKLKVSIADTPGVHILVRLDFSGPFENAT